MRVWGRQLDPSSGAPSGLPASRAQKPGSAALAQPGCAAEKDTGSLPQPGPPTKHCAAQGEPGCSHRHTPAQPRPGRGRRPSASEPKGPQRPSDPHFTWIPAGSLSFSHPDYPPPRVPGHPGIRRLASPPARAHRGSSPTARGRPAWARRPVFMFPGAPPPVLAVVVVGTGVTLAAEARGLLARLRLVVPQHVGGLCTRGQRQGSGGWGRGMRSRS